MRSGRYTSLARVGVLAAALAAPLAFVSASAAHAAPAASAEVSRLQTECARLRTDLERANADVAALKRERGVRSDYRLRQRMADAEALARKLTEAEAQLRARQGTPTPPRPPELAPPSAQPGDGPIELAAKADLLADQARRLTTEAEGLARSAGRLRGRQTLQRRANQLDRDPFAGLDGSKRSLVFGVPRGRSQGPENNQGGKTVTPTAGDAADNGSGAGGASGGGPGRGPTPPTAPGASTPTTGNTGGAVAQPMTPVSVPQPTSALSVQLRTLLDPSTLAEVQRLERTGRAITDPEALERLAIALRQRAQSLAAQASDLRARAKP
jgi:hypothetical protein